MKEVGRWSETKEYERLKKEFIRKILIDIQSHGHIKIRDRSNPRYQNEILNATIFYQTKKNSFEVYLTCTKQGESAPNGIYSQRSSIHINDNPDLINQTEGTQRTANFSSQLFIDKSNPNHKGDESEYGEFQIVTKFDTTKSTERYPTAISDRTATNKEAIEFMNQLMQASIDHAATKNSHLQEITNPDEDLVSSHYPGSQNPNLYKQFFKN